MIQRGEIWWGALPDPRGSQPGYRRPVLVIQADSFNRSRIQTVVVAAITSNLTLAAAPGNVRLATRVSGLQRASVVNVSQLWTLDRSYLPKRIAQLPASVMAEVDDGLRRVLAL